jgi:hypothetical protein
MRYIIFLAGVMLTFAVAHADIYQWKDTDGGVHFTDNQDRIPPGYRNKAKKVDVTPAIQSSEKTGNSTPSTGQNDAVTYGGHDEMWWRTSFKALRDQITNYQGNLTDKKAKLVELRRSRNLYMKREDRQDLNDMEGEVKHDEEQLVNLENRLSDLDYEASKYGVPLEWRK